MRGRELIAHELTHTIQQGGVIQRAAMETKVAERTGEAVQRLSWDDIKSGASSLVNALGDPLQFLADKARNIPGFDLFCLVIGANPITMQKVDPSAANVIKALVGLIPGGNAVIEALQNNGIFDKVANWFAGKVKAAVATATAIKEAVTKFIGSLKPTDIADPLGVWQRAKSIFDDPINQVKVFCKGVITDILKFVKDAILIPLEKLAEGTDAWPLLLAVLGKNPITDEKVDPKPDVLIGGFMKLIGQEEVWKNMQESKATSRAFAWFKDAVSAVKGFVTAIPGKFMELFKSLTIEDVVLVAGAFKKVASVLGGFVADFISWGSKSVFNLLEIIFDVVSPGAFAYVKKTGAALKDILKNPLPFVGNLVKAAKLGLQNFADNIGTHLKAGLIDWLIGAIPGVYIPQAFSLIEIGKFALSVLGITWGQIRAKIVTALGPTGETIMKGLETAFDVVVALVKGGPAAAWELIKEKLTDLKDTVIGGLISFVTETIVLKAIPKLVSLFVPGAGFISAIISIYGTIKSFLEQLAKIAAAIKAFVDSIVAIAAGQIEGAAKKVESALAGVLSIAIGLLAGFLNLGGIPSKIKGVIEKVRATIDKAIDTAITWIVGKAKALFAKLFGKGKDGKTPPKGQIETFEQPFDMAGAGHDVSVEVIGGKPLLTMASGAKASLADLISKVLNSSDPKVKAKLVDPGLRSTLTTIKQQVDTLNKFMYDNIEQLYLQNESYNKTTVQMVSTAKGSIIQELRALGQKHGIKNLSELGHPSKYVLDDKVRPELKGKVRETFYNVSWDGTATGYKAGQMTTLRKQAQTKRPSIKELLPSERDNWYWSEDRSGKVGPPAIVNVNDKNGSPELDHVEPLAVRWLSTGKPKPGNDTVQGDRDKDYVNTGNLQVLAKWMNLQKGGGQFDPKVGPNFRGPNE